MAGFGVTVEVEAACGFEDAVEFGEAWEHEDEVGGELFASVDGEYGVYEGVEFGVGVFVE